MGKPASRAGRSVLVYAHRGYHVREPENSLAAIASALEMGVDGVEIDLRVTSDGSVICFHDWYLKRLTGTSGRVGRMSIHSLLETPLRHRRSHIRRPVATLDEVLALVGDRSRLILDLKTEGVRSSVLEQETVRQLRQHGLRESVIVSSFNPWVLRRVRQLAPEFSTALIAGSRLAVRLYSPEYCDGLHASTELSRRRWFQAIADRFPWVFVWTVDDRNELPDLWPDFVKGIITNRPERWGRKVAARAGAHRTA